MRSATLACGALLAVFLTQSAEARRLDSAITLGEGVHLYSKVLGEERRLLIALPDSYGKTQRSYPSLYVLDAEAQFVTAAALVSSMAKNDQIPEMVVIGITNTQRNRDLVPSLPYHHSNGHPMSGAAVAFARFVVGELQPWVRARYRVNDFRILAGHSNGGLFALHLIMTRPASFSAYLAMSPSHGDDMTPALVKALHALRADQFVFLSSADHEPNIGPATGKLAARLSQAPSAAVRWTSRHFDHETHRTSVQPALYAGLRALYDGYLADDLAPPNAMGYAASAAELEAHYARLSGKLGTELPVPSGAYAGAARMFLKSQSTEQWQAICRAWVAAYPDSAEANAQMGDALVAAGRRGEAHLAYEKSIELAAGDEDPYGWAAEYRRKADETRANGEGLKK